MRVDDENTALTYSTRARGRERAQTFAVVFYGSKKFCRKTTQFERQREPVCLGLALKNRVRNDDR
jgi:hypothetical protein